MVLSTQAMSITEFDALIQQDAYAERAFEYIAGEMVEVVSNNYASELASKFHFFLRQYLREHQLGGRVTGADGGYIIAGERYIPDVAYTSQTKQPQPSRQAYNSIPPDLVIEVISDPSRLQELNALRVKVVNYLAEGVLVWVVNPDARVIEVYQPGTTARFVGVDGVLDGASLLPDLRIPVREIFEDE